MNPFFREYYDQPAFWDNDYGNDPGNLERLRAVAEALPLDVRSVLDVGCANGKALQAILDRIPPAEIGFLAGIDFSEHALRAFDLPRVCADCSRLPFPDASFDAVLCLEVLEHLPQEAYLRTLEELQRVSSRYLLISVPNDEDLKGSSVMCPHCYCWFNKNFHMKSFDADRLFGLFQPLFAARRVQAIGPLEKRYCIPPFVRELRRFLLEPAPPAVAICPQCGSRQNKSSKALGDESWKLGPLRSTVSLFKGWVRRVWPKTERGRWLLVLYARV